MEEKLLKSINKRLEIIIALLLRARIKEPDILTRRDQIDILRDLGLNASDIASILGRSSRYIHKELFKLRNKKARKVKR